MLLDAHCHLDYYDNPLWVVNESAKREVFLVAVTNLPSQFEQSLPHIKNHKNIRLALGFHPLMAEKYSQEIPDLDRLLTETSYIGEVGLDFSKDGRGSMFTQTNLLKTILEKTGKDKIISLHSRMADEKVLDMLIDNNATRAIFHWFSGSLKILNKAIKAGFYFSVNPRMCQTINGQKILSSIPIDQLLTETDGPFNGTNGRPYYPWDVEIVLNYVSNLHMKSFEEIKNQIWMNFKRLVQN